MALESGCLFSVWGSVVPGFPADLWQRHQLNYPWQAVSAGLEPAKHIVLKLVMSPKSILCLPGSEEEILQRIVLGHIVQFLPPKNKK